VNEIDPIEDLIRGWPEGASWKVRSWASKSAGFRDFARDNGTKVRSRFARAKEREDKDDVLAELEFAAAVASDLRFVLSYEPYGPAGGRNPDFFVCADGLQDFHLEVKRIRETGGTIEITKFVEAIITAARAIPSSLGISINISGECPIEMGHRLRAATPAVVAWCEQLIRDSEHSLAPGDDRKFPVDGFEEDELTVTVTKVPGKDPTTPTAFLSLVSPVAYTQRESLKFGDHVAGCLGQMRSSSANVLAVKIDSTPHDPRDLTQALHQLGEQVISGDDDFFRNKGFEGAKDFSEKFALLSAVVVKSNWVATIGSDPSNLVWVNEAPAVQLNSGCVEHLRSA
jgi:hypothetical protein